MRNVIGVLVTLCLLGFGATAAEAQSARVVADTDCGGCDGSPKQACLLGCPIEAPMDCGPCYSGSGPGDVCMDQSNGCGSSLAVLLDGTLMVLSPANGEDRTLDVQVYEELVEGQPVLYGRRNCDGALVTRHYVAQHADKLRRAVSVLSI